MKKGIYTFLLSLFVMVISAQSGFTMWQLPSQEDNIGNSYVFLTNKGKVIVMDGGRHPEAPYLRGFLSALGGTVDAWIVTHPHWDHVGALTTIIEKPLGIKIKKVYHSRFSKELAATEYPSGDLEFYHALDSSNIPQVDIHTPGLQVKIDGLNFKILGVTNEEIRVNPYNNSSMVVKVWDKKKSIVFLGDTGEESGEKLLKSKYKKDLDCDYLQVAHHGQAGCNEEFYKNIKFKVCLWPTPSWLWNNDQGKGYNTGIFKTIETRKWMENLGIKENHVTGVEGIFKLE